MADPLAELRATVHAAVEAVGDGALSGEPTLERPPKPEMGDYSTNAAMLLAPVRGEKPRDIAELLSAPLSERLGERATRVEVAGPGFVNLHLTDRWHREAVTAMLTGGRDYGRVPSDHPQRILAEFVSANPTGPLTVAGARGGAYGDSLVRLLEATGHEVGREYLLNDVGGQIDRFAASIAARMRGDETPKDGYSGEYVGELASELVTGGASADDLDELARRGTEAMRKRIAATLERFGVGFDTWFSQRTLEESGAVETVVEALRSRGHAYDSGGAVWLRTTDFGDDKDRVLIRADGQPTYFAADVAYHLDKLDRGWEHLIVPVGSDHHGYTPRVKAALAALGADPDAYEALIMQFVQVVEAGERAKMSKRKGEFVTLDDLLDDIGTDATRFFMLQRSHDTPLDLDLDLARSQSQDNPVYYVQYAHARIGSILRKAIAEGAAAAEGDKLDETAAIRAATTDGALDASAEPAETALVRRLLELPGEISSAAERRAPHRLCAYAMATAADFHAFYRDCQVVGAGEGLEPARIGICLATKRAIATTLELLGVSAPERM